MVGIDLQVLIHFHGRIIRCDIAHSLRLRIRLTGDRVRDRAITAISIFDKFPLFTDANVHETTYVPRRVGAQTRGRIIWPMISVSGGRAQSAATVY